MTDTELFERPRVLLAGIASGVGKSSVAIGITAALKGLGRKVTPFKIGPDYLDPKHLSYASGETVYNLDPWIQGQDYLLRKLADKSSSQGIAVLEGAMGLFDGPRGSQGITAEVAAVTASPVILVVDAAKSGQSAMVGAWGLMRHASGFQIEGVVINNSSGQRHEKLLESAASSLGLRVLGYLPRVRGSLGEQHLGLREEADLEYYTEMARVAAERLDLNAITDIARRAPVLSCQPALKKTVFQEKAVVAVATDEAFSFYYPDTLEALEDAGARLRFFSPLDDSALPEADGYLFGGGYPENHAPRLSSNKEMRKAVCAAAAEGKPVYGECGGALYLSHELVDQEGRGYPLCGVVPHRAVMKKGLRDFGYKEATVLKANVLASEGQKLRGHEFHWSAWEPDAGEAAAYALANNWGESKQEGYAGNRVLASYLHLMMGAHPALAENFVASCLEARQ